MRNDLIDKITSSLNLKDVMEFYGVQFNSRGFANCPFHKEKTASLTIKKEHYKCFGCGAYGGILDFVMEHHKINLPQAIVRLNADFQLGLTMKKPTYREQRQQAENRRIERAKEEWRADIHKQYLSLCTVHSILFGRLINGEAWLKDTVETLGKLLDDYSGEEARNWKMAMMS